MQSKLRLGSVDDNVELDFLQPFRDGTRYAPQGPGFDRNGGLGLACGVDSAANSEIWSNFSERGNSGTPMGFVESESFRERVFSVLTDLSASS